MNPVKKVKPLLVTLGLGLFLGACSGGQGQEAGGESSGEAVQVGILSSAEHNSLADAEEGFKEAFADAGYVEGEDVVFNSQNAQGNNNTLHDMSSQLAKENDLLLGISTASGQAFANIESEKPILFTAVTDPVGAGLVQSLEEPGGNVTGTSDAAPIKEQIDLLISIDPDAEKVGIIYNSGEQNSVIQAEEAAKYIEEQGKEAVQSTVTSTNDVQQVAESLLNDVDLLWIPTDNTLSAAADTVGQLAIEAQVPIVAASIDHTEVGGLATYGISYFNTGKQAGKMAVDILQNGKSPAEIPVEKAEEIELYINEEMAEALGIDPASIEMQ